jgi:hypothetical protein
MRDLCEDASAQQSHSMHKLVGFFPLGAAALSLRMAGTLFYLNADEGWEWQVGGPRRRARSAWPAASALRCQRRASPGRGALSAPPLCPRLPLQRRVGVLAGVWLALLLIKPLFGYFLKTMATRYVRHFNAKQQHGGGKHVSRVIHRKDALRSLIGGRPKAE